MTYPGTRFMRGLFWLAPLLFCSIALSQNGALRLTEPTPAKDGTFVTSNPAIHLTGTLAWAGGDKRVLWESNRGFHDLATVNLADDGKTILWSTTAPVPLRPGINHVQIKALGQPGAATFLNIFYTPISPAPTPPVGTTILWGKQITYEVIDGLAIYQSDIILGKAADVAAKRFSGRLASSREVVRKPDSITLAPNPLDTTSGLWPVVNGVVRIPYTNSSGLNTTNVNAAIAEANTQLAGVIQWVPATASDVNLVDFDFNGSNSGGGCEPRWEWLEGRKRLAGHSFARKGRCCTRWGTQWASFTSSRARTATRMSIT